MAEIRMPSFGDDRTTGTIVRWLKAPGDSVQRGEAIVEVETDKVAVEVESTASGVLRAIVHGDGAEVAIGETIAYIDGAE